MLIAQPALHMMAAAAIADIERDGGRVAPADVLWLHMLAVRVSGGLVMDKAAWCDLPITCGGIGLLPLSPAGEAWLEDYAGPWFDGDRKRELLAIAYAMSRGRKPGAFDAMHDEAQARHELRKLKSQIHATWAELSACIDRVAGVSGVSYVRVESAMEDKGHAAQPHDFGRTLALLMEHVGGRVEDYTYVRSSDQVYALIDQLCRDESDGPSPSKIRAMAQFEEAKKIVKGRAHGC